MELLRYHFHKQNLINTLQWLVWCYLCNDSVLFGLILILERWGNLEYSCIRCQSITCKSLHFAMFPFRKAHWKPLDLLDEDRHWEIWVYCLIMETTQLNDPIVRLRFDLLTPLFRCYVIVSALDCISRSLGEPQSGPLSCSFLDKNLGTTRLSGKLHNFLRGRERQEY